MAMEVTLEEMNAHTGKGIDPNRQWAGPRPARIGSTEEEEA
jgi:hypothetical protein